MFWRRGQEPKFIEVERIDNVGHSCQPRSAFKMADLCSKHISVLQAFTFAETPGYPNNSMKD